MSESPASNAAISDSRHRTPLHWSCATCSFATDVQAVSLPIEDRRKEFQDNAQFDDGPVLLRDLRHGKSPLSIAARSSYSIVTATVGDSPRIHRFKRLKESRIALLAKRRLSFVYVTTWGTNVLHYDSVHLAPRLVATQTNAGGSRRFFCFLATRVCVAKTHQDPPLYVPVSVRPRENVVAVLSWKRSASGLARATPSSR